MTVLGVPVRDRMPLGGGATRVGLADGRTVVVKDGDEQAIAAEAAGLRWLGGAGGAPVPAVLDVDGIAARFGKDAWNDAVLWHTAKQYPSAAGMPGSSQFTMPSACRSRRSSRPSSSMLSMMTCRSKCRPLNRSASAVIPRH